MSMQSAMAQHEIDKKHNYLNVKFSRSEENLSVGVTITSHCTGKQVQAALISLLIKSYNDGMGEENESLVSYLARLSTMVLIHSTLKKD